MSDKPKAKEKGKYKGPKAGHDPLKFTQKQELFCQEWVKDRNATQAAIRAGYSKKTAGAIGNELLRNPKISERIDKARHQALMNATLTDQMIIDELKALGLWSVKDFVEEGNTIPDLTKLSRETLKPITGIKVTERFDLQGNLIRTVELKTVDKRAAIVDLGRHLGIFEKDNNQKAIKIKVTRQ